MEQTKTYLETELGFDVVAGYLSPSSDLYVKPKMMRYQKKGQPLGASFADASHRICLTQKAVADSTWLSCSTWEANHEQFKDFDEVLYALDVYLRESDIFATEADKVFYVCGGDHFMKCQCGGGIHCRDDGRTRSVAVVTRCSEGTTEAVLPRTVPPCRHVVVVPPMATPSASTVCATSGLSSTRVRDLLNKASQTDVTSSEQASYLEALREMLPAAVFDHVMGQNSSGESLYRLS